MLNWNFNSDWAGCVSPSELQIGCIIWFSPLGKPVTQTLSYNGCKDAKCFQSRRCVLKLSFWKIMPVKFYTSSTAQLLLTQVSLLLHHLSHFSLLLTFTHVAVFASLSEKHRSCANKEEKGKFTQQPQEQRITINLMYAASVEYLNRQRIIPKLRWWILGAMIYTLFSFFSFLWVCMCMLLCVILSV